MHSQSFEDYVSQVKKKSEELVKKEFPKRIKELNELLESPEFDMELQKKSLWQPLNIPVPDAQAIARAIHLQRPNHLDEEEFPVGKKRKMNNVGRDEYPEEHVITTGGTRVLALPTGPVNCNVVIASLFDAVKPQIRQLVEYANLLKMWVTFLIPKIEDGNNFGVSIQEDTLGEIRTVEAETATFYEQITRYHMSRAKLISKVAKYPHIDDYRQVIAELDEKEFLSMRLVVCEIRNHYSSLFDLISKNWEKIIKPRTSNTENLY